MGQNSTHTQTQINHAPAGANTVALETLVADIDRIYAARPHDPQRFCCCSQRSNTSSSHPSSR